MLLLCQLISIVIIQVKQNHYSPSVVSKMSMHSWTILFLTFVKVIHVNGTLINREPVLGELFGRSPNRIFGCPVLHQPLCISMGQLPLRRRCRRSIRAVYEIFEVKFQIFANHVKPGSWLGDINITDFFLSFIHRSGFKINPK